MTIPPEFTLSTKIVAAGGRVLDLGCGSKKRPGSVGLDISRHSSADVVSDLNRPPLPFHENSFDLVVADNVLEHATPFVPIVEEIHRITKPGGLVEILVPFYADRWNYNDPTHVRSFAWRSFDYFVDGTDMRRYRYSLCCFDKIEVRYEYPGFRRRLVERPLVWLANRFKDAYENRFANLYPVHNIYFLLRALKPT